MDFRSSAATRSSTCCYIGALLLIGMSLISTLTGAKQITTQEGLTLLKAAPSPR